MLGTEHFDYGTNHRVDLSYQEQKIAEIPATITTVASYTGIFPSTEKTRFFAGANMMQEKLGLTNLLKYEGKIGVAFGGYGFRDLFSFGISIGQYQFSVKTTNAKVVDRDDIAVAEGISQNSGPDIGVGLFYLKRIKDGVFKEDQYYFGLSFSQIFTPDFLNNNESRRSPSSFQGGDYFFTAGYNRFFDDGISFHPSIWIVNRVGSTRRVTEVMGKIGMKYKPVFLTIGYGHNKAVIFEIEYGLKSQVIPIRLGVSWSNNLLVPTGINNVAETGVRRGLLTVPWGGNR